jgi:type I restriction enzyme S subunit
MTALVTKHLPLVAGAPDGIKSLRALILELAVRGRLLPTVPQTNSDVPAEWIQTKLGSILAFEYGDNLPAAKRSNTGEYPVYGSNGVVGTHSVCFVQQPCIVIGRKGSAGALNLCTSPGCCVTDVAYYCVPPQSMSLEYTFKLLHTLGLDNLGKGIKPGLNRNEAYALEVLVPPLAEQHRIVAKVDELMALCDRLEADQADAEAAHAQLVQALLGSLTQATDAADFRASWQRLSEHFHTLLTTEASIDALKQTVLQLAVMGKLVPQSFLDEPASDLLSRARAATVKAAKAGSGATPLPVDLPFELPSGWAWARFNALITPEFPIAYGVLVPGPDSVDGVPFVRIADLDLVAPRPLPEKRISPEVDAQFARTRLRGGEILMGVVGSIGKLGLAPASWAGANIARAVCRIVPTSAVSKPYVLWLLQTQFMKHQFLGDTRTLAQPTLNVGLIRDALTPVPPLAEQHRIVAKVDELMALCDQLKVQLQQARQQHAQLADALVSQAVA